MPHTSQTATLAVLRWQDQWAGLVLYAPAIGCYLTPLTRWVRWPCGVVMAYGYGFGGAGGGVSRTQCVCSFEQTLLPSVNPPTHVSLQKFLGPVLDAAVPNLPICQPVLAEALDPDPAAVRCLPANVRCLPANERPCKIAWDLLPPPCDGYPRGAR